MAQGEVYFPGLVVWGKMISLKVIKVLNLKKMSSVNLWPKMVSGGLNVYLVSLKLSPVTFFLKFRMLQGAYGEGRIPRVQCNSYGVRQQLTVQLCEGQDQLQVFFSNHCYKRANQDCLTPLGLFILFMQSVHCFLFSLFIRSLFSFQEHPYFISAVTSNHELI